jgi:GntR family transcriptional regulator / MocR family aminotransferase
MVIDQNQTRLPALFALDRTSPLPVYRQLYDRTRAAIASGQLPPGERLPSTRSLAAQLGTARGTVDAAYAMLAGEGWIVARGAAGTVVAPQLAEKRGGPSPTRMVTRPTWSSPYSTEMSPRPFRLGLPALDAFPRKLWSRLVASEARALSPAGMAHPDPAGNGKLREAIVAYLAIARGISCEPRRVFVTAGYQGALGLAARAVIVADDEVWFEDPGYHLARQGLTAAGARLIPVPVDGEGMRIADGITQAPRARFVVVTPSHQCPLGVPLSLPRRLALLSWAAAAGAWVIEDDYDGEFHYAGRPLPALKSLDRADVVLYAGSFSKVLFPALRLGYMVVPDRLVENFARASCSFHAGNAGLEQAVVARFMSEGHFARHLKRMRGLYGVRRAALADALAAAFGERLCIDRQPGGMHLLARPTGNARDTDLVCRAERHGLAPAALSPLSINKDCGQGLLLGFTNIPEERAPELAEALRRAIENPVTSSPSLARGPPSRSTQTS